MAGWPLLSQATSTPIRTQTRDARRRAVTTLTELVADILDDGDWLTANELFKELPDEARDLVGDAAALHTFLCGKPDWFVWKDKIGVWTLTCRQPGRTHLRLTAPSTTAVTLDTEPTEPRDAVPAAEEPAKGAVRTPAPVRPTPTRPSSKKATPVPIRVTPSLPKPRAASKAEAGSKGASVPRPNRGRSPAKPLKPQAVAGTDPPQSSSGHSVSAYGAAGSLPRSAWELLCTRRSKKPSSSSLRSV